MLGAPLAHPFGAFCGVGGRGKTDVQGGAGPPSGTPRSVWDVGGAFGASLRGFLWCWRQREDGRARGGRPPLPEPPRSVWDVGAPSASLRGFLWCWRQREDGLTRSGQALAYAPACPRLILG